MVWAHWRNFGFLLASSYSQKQTPQVTKSSNSLVTPMVNIRLCVRRVTTYFQLIRSYQSHVVISTIKAPTFKFYQHYTYLFDELHIRQTNAKIIIQ